MITKKCDRYGSARNNCFWIVGSMPNDCYRELAKYAKDNPTKIILYYNCGTKPARPIPIPETIFEVYPVETINGLLLGWKVYKLKVNEP